MDEWSERELKLTSSFNYFRIGLPLFKLVHVRCTHNSSFNPSCRTNAFSHILLSFCVTSILLLLQIDARADPEGGDVDERFHERCSSIMACSLSP